jgi:parallel beta-helix repeat protein
MSRARRHRRHRARWVSRAGLVLGFGIVIALAAFIGANGSRDEVPDHSRIGPRPSETAAAGSRSWCRGVRIRPRDDLRDAVRSRGKETTFCIKRGTHRVSRSIKPKPNQKFIGEPGAVVSGAKLLTGWTKSGAVYYVDGQTQESPPHGTCAAGDACRYNEDVYLDDKLLTRATSLGALSSGGFYFDYSADRIYIADDPSGHKLEGAATARFLNGNQVTGVTVRGLVVEKFANRAQAGAISSGPGWIVDSNEVRFNHGIGITQFGDGNVVRDNNIHHNGQLGMGGYRTTNALVENNEIAYNNTAGFMPGWEAGATKWAQGSNLTVRNNNVHDNYGNGLWTDGDVNNVLYENNVSVRNQGNGLHHEVACKAIIRNNTVEDNDYDGIAVTASQDVEVYGNTVKNNDHAGIAVRHQFRSQAANVPWNCKWTLNNVRIHNNDITMQTGATGIWKCCGVTDGDTIFSSGDARVEFYDNTYHVPSTSGRFWQLYDRVITADEWRSNGNDTGGAFRRT